MQVTKTKPQETQPSFDLGIDAVDIASSPVSVAATPLHLVDPVDQASAHAVPDLVMSIPAFMDYIQRQGMAIEQEGGSARLMFPTGFPADKIARISAFARARQDEITLFLEEKAPQENSDVSKAPDDYALMIGAAYRAAIEDRMPKGKVLLGKKRYTTDPSIMLQELVSDSLCLQKQYGARWREDAPDGERIASDIETISSWYQRWYWLQGKTADPNRSNCLLNEGGVKAVDDSLVKSINSPSGDDVEVF